MKEMISSYLSSEKIVESKNSNVSVIDKLGDAMIRNVVKSILKGGNLRDLTEDMTRKRVLMNNVALIAMYFKAFCAEEDLEKNLTSQIGLELSLPTKKVSKAKKDLLLALIGMTRKGWDNIVRRNTGKEIYLKKLDMSLYEIEQEICNEYGTFEAEVAISGQKRILPTASLIRCMLALGSQTLAIRGSEKSIYGKLFERLVLGSVLTILGFRKIERNDVSDTNMVFWLSDPKDKRECDATALITPGLCVRFDIGFIGRGNPEVSLDKVTRYGHLLEIKNRNGTQISAKSYTIIIVDTIGEGSRVKELAEEIGGYVIQMNCSYWIKELAETIKKIYPKQFRSPISGRPPEYSLDFVDQEMPNVEFINLLSRKAASVVRKGTKRLTR